MPQLPQSPCPLFLSVDQPVLEYTEIHLPLPPPPDRVSCSPGWPQTFCWHKRHVSPLWKLLLQVVNIWSNVISNCCSLLFYLEASPRGTLLCLGLSQSRAPGADLDEASLGGSLLASLSTHYEDVLLVKASYYSCYFFPVILACYVLIISLVQNQNNGYHSLFSGPTKVEGAWALTPKVVLQRIQSHPHTQKNRIETHIPKAQLKGSSLTDNNYDCMGDITRKFLRTWGLIHH